MAQHETVIQVKDLKTYFYSDKRCNKALNGVSFEIKQGKTLGIVGESGCGKSVTAHSIMQLLPELSRIESGEIIYHTEDGNAVHIEELSKNSKQMRKLRGQDIAMIFQDPMTALNPVYTIGYQIKESIKAHNKIKNNDAKNRSIGLLEHMGIANPTQRVNEYPHQYSGGMRQRAMIAMAMSNHPRVLIADEPTTALDVTIQAQIFELMNRLKTEYNTAVMLITHDMGVINEITDDVAVMYMGNIIESGVTKDVLRKPAHPYTKALLQSIPILNKGKQQKLQPIKGSTPDPYNRPIGCQFSTRCDFCSEACSVMPKEEILDGNHMVRCWHYKEVLESGK
jgi:peptide/nickel transport system ATP-binding protein